MSHEFILTTVVYGVLSVLRFLEYLVLAVQFYRFLFIQELVNVPDFLRKHSKRYYYLLLFSVILLPYFLLGIIIPALGIYQELEHSMRLEECYQHYPEVYITYCVINILNTCLPMLYASSSFLRLWQSANFGVQSMKEFQPTPVVGIYSLMSKWQQEESH